MDEKKRIIPKSMMKVVIPTLIVLVIAAVVAIINWDMIIHFFKNPDEIKHYVQAAGPWGPVVFMSVQFLQIIIAPIPGQAVGFLAGALFGPWLGTLYSVAGALLGFTTIFILAKLLGRPFVERFVKKHDLDKFDRLTKKAGPLVLFLIFLLPGFPDDAICYIAGLSNLPIRTLVLVSLAGRLPGYLATSFIGAGFGGANIQLIVGTGVVLGLAAVVAYVQRARIKAFIDKHIGDSETQ